jgi:RimJ/RimL family protein N-acetyltransferase
MKRFPSVSQMRWRRTDVPGREDARVEQTPGGWRLTGEVEADEAGVRAQLAYVIDCECDWRTRRAVITGSAAGAPIRLEFAADGKGHWMLDGAPLPLVEGALDIDLGFTPATNLLPIRRLDLAVGQRADVRTAWVRFPELRVEVLEQSYRREADRVFRYEALVDGERFEARLDTDEFGRVLVYEGLWEAADARMIEIVESDSPARAEVARTLVREYQAALGVDLGFQSFEAELQNLPGDYARPRGRLLVAFGDHEPAGCVAMRPLTGDTCEMKRLYVRPAYRAAGVGRQLVQRVIAEARSAGYRKMYLDTLPVMTGAQRLYESMGFKDVPPYRYNPIAGTRYLGLDL